MLDTIVTKALRAIETDRVVNLITRLSNFDRYQASHGINQAAVLVAAEARDAGLSNVVVHRFAADGETRWWCFDAIPSWTPLIGRCAIAALGLELDHATQPFTLATGSAATTGVEALPIVWMDALEQSAARGSIVVVPAQDWRGLDLLERLDGLGARGFITDAAQRRDVLGHDVPGRIELPKGSALFGFSTTVDRVDQLMHLKHQPLKADVQIAIDRTASMPVVTGVIPGLSNAPEIWIVAHLCHPRPSANDNASGVAGSIEIARLLNSSLPAALDLQPNIGVRFIWGPEFAGKAAFLHAALHHFGLPLPSLVINLDMIGEDQAVCGGPLVIERPPHPLMHPIVPVAEALMHEAFVATRDQPGTWTAVPFTGFSDHTIFADASVAVPAVQIAHINDRFNHSAADSPDKVSTTELRRAISAAALTALVFASLAPSASAIIDAAIQVWRAREASPPDFNVSAIVAAPPRFMLNACLPSPKPDFGSLLIPPIEADAAPKDPITRNWQGPFNLRAFLNGVRADTRSQILMRVRDDPSALSALIHIGILIDGTRDDETIIKLACGHQEEIETHHFAWALAQFLSAGWASKATNRT